MAGISELSRAQNLASLEHQLRSVRQCLGAVWKEEPRHPEQVGVAQKASERNQGLPDGGELGRWSLGCGGGG